jgi:hypothetical protein
MKPKRYTLQYALDMNVKINTKEDDEMFEENDEEPQFQYTDVEYGVNKLNKRTLKRINAVINDCEGIVYNIEYVQNCDYVGRTLSESEPLLLKVKYRDDYATNEKEIKFSNQISFRYEKRNGMHMYIKIEFHPHGLVIINKHYTDEHDVTHCETTEFKKNEEWWDEDDEFKLKQDYDDDWMTELNDECTIIKRTKTYENTEQNVTIPFSVTLLPENSIEVFAYEVVQQINNKLKTHTNDNVKRCEVLYDYESYNNTLTFIYRINNEDTGYDDRFSVEARFVPVDDRHRNECITFNNILNQTDYPIDPKYDTITSFHNVWNREHFFVHASFMNLIQYNQLGRSGEIYPKPTKLTRYSSTIPDIEFWTSLNGVDPFVLHDQDFEVDLALAATLNNADITF